MESTPDGVLFFRDKGLNPKPLLPLSMQRLVSYSHKKFFPCHNLLSWFVYTVKGGYTYE